MVESFLRWPVRGVQASPRCWEHGFKCKQICQSNFLISFFREKLVFSGMTWDVVQLSPVAWQASVMAWPTRPGGMSSFGGYQTEPPPVGGGLLELLGPRPAAWLVWSVFVWVLVCRSVGGSVVSARRGSRVERLGRLTVGAAEGMASPGDLRPLGRGDSVPGAVGRRSPFVRSCGKKERKKCLSL